MRTTARLTGVNPGVSRGAFPGEAQCFEWVAVLGCLSEAPMVSDDDLPGDYAQGVAASATLHGRNDTSVILDPPE